MIFGKTNKSDPAKQGSFFKQKVTDETEKFAESLKSQISGSKQEDSERPLLEDLVTEGGRINPILPKSEEDNIAAMDKKRLAEIEAEMRRFRFQRTQEAEDYSQKMQSQFDANKPKSDETPFVMPKGKDLRSKTPGAGGKGKSKGSGEMLKAKK